MKVGDSLLMCGELVHVIAVAIGRVTVKAGHNSGLSTGCVRSRPYRPWNGHEWGEEKTANIRVVALDEEYAPASGYRLWCRYLRQCGLMPRSKKCAFAREQWNLYWAGARGGELHDAASYLIATYGR